MIFTKDLLYLHLPKTGGMMLTYQLLRKLNNRVYYTLPKGHLSPRERGLTLFGNVKVLNGIRHENLQEASRFFDDHDLPHHLKRFKCIVVVIRNPYDYMVSRFHYLKNNLKYNKGAAASLAAEGDFRKFAIEAPRYYPIESFILNEENEIPANLNIIRFETMHIALNDLLSPYLKKQISFTRRVNISVREHYENYIIDSEIEEAVYQKFRYLFDAGYYQRLKI